MIANCCSDDDSHSTLDHAAAAAAAADHPLDAVDGSNCSHYCHN